MFSVTAKCPHSKAFSSVYCVIVIRCTVPGHTAVCHSSGELSVFSFFRAARPRRAALGGAFNRELAAVNLLDYISLAPTKHSNLYII